MKKLKSISILSALAGFCVVLGGCIYSTPPDSNSGASGGNSTGDSTQPPAEVYESKFAMSEGIALKLNEKTNTYTVVGVGTCKENEIKISHTYNGKKVTAIAENSFENCKQLTRVDIDNGIEKIGKNAFKNCTNLNRLFLGEQIETIDSGAFTLCYNLAEICNTSDIVIETGKSGNGNVGYYAEKLVNTVNEFSTIEIDNGFVYKLGEEENLLCGYIGAETEITLPESYKGKGYSINRYAFYDTGISVINLAENTVEFDFLEYMDLEELHYPRSLADWCAFTWDEATYNPIKKDCVFYANDTAIEGDLTVDFDVNAYAFSGYPHITSLTITPNCKNIGAHAFEKTSTTNVVIQDGGITAISDFTFNYCTSLTNVVFSNSITSIGANAFEYTKLVELTLPNQLQSMGNSAFFMVSTLKKVTVPGTVKIIPNQCFGYTGLTEVTLGEGIERIEDAAFINCQLERLKIPDTCKYLGLRAFYKNIKLTYVDLGDGLEQIGYNIQHNAELGINTNYTSTTFAQCWTLKTVIFGKSIQHVGRYAFVGDHYPDEVDYYYKGTMEELVALFNNTDGNKEAHIHDQQMRYYVVNPTAYAKVNWRFYSKTKPTEAKLFANPDPGTGAQGASWPWVVQKIEGATQEQLEATYDNYWYYGEDGQIVHWSEK